VVYFGFPNSSRIRQLLLLCTPLSDWLHIFLIIVRQPLVCQALLIIDASRSHSDAPQSVARFWTSDRPEAKPSTWQHTTLTTDRLSCPGCDSNPHS